MGDFANGLSYIADSYMGAFSHWFVVSYLGLCLLSPILNAWLEKTDDGALLKYIAIFYIFSTLFGYLFYAKFHRPVDFNEGMSILSFVGLYLVGALIRRNSFSWLRKGKMLYLAVFARCGVLLVAVAYTALLFGLTVSPYGYINPLVVIESAALFIFFTKLHMGEIRWINIIAGSHLPFSYSITSARATNTIIKFVVIFRKISIRHFLSRFYSSWQSIYL